MTASTPPTELRTLGDLHLGAFRKVKSLLMLAYVALEGPCLLYTSPSPRD